MRKIKIGLVEDNANLARAFSANISAFENAELIFTATNGQEALHMLATHKPDVLMMDIQMPVMDGIEATRRVRHLFPELKVLMLTVFDDGERIFSAILAGANGYLLKDEKPGKIISAIEEAIEGGAPMSPVIANKALQLIRGKQEQKASEGQDFGLTKREIEIMELIARGETYQQIADKIFISPKTVRKHIENIYVKLHVHNKVDAVRVATQNKII